MRGVEPSKHDSAEFRELKQGFRLQVFNLSALLHTFQQPQSHPAIYCSLSPSRLMTIFDQGNP